MDVVATRRLTTSVEVAVVAHSTSLHLGAVERLHFVALRIGKCRARLRGTTRRLNGTGSELSLSLTMSHHVWVHAHVHGVHAHHWHTQAHTGPLSAAHHWVSGLRRERHGETKGGRGDRWQLDMKG